MPWLRRYTAIEKGLPVWAYVHRQRLFSTLLV